MDKKKCQFYAVLYLFWSTLKLSSTCDTCASGFCRLSVVRRSQQCHGLRRGFSKSMACSVENCDMGSGVVHPATDAYAGEAVEALKAGKVIAVPTDTLYGFACDAWYAAISISTSKLILPL